MPIAVHLRLGIGQPDAAVAVVIANGIFRIVTQFFIEGDRMRFQPYHRLVHAKIRHLCCRMPCGARGQLVPFDQHHVAPALSRQVIEGRTACDASADDNDTGARFHGRGLSMQNALTARKHGKAARDK